jgi:peptidoglycan/LPS O-acetylase OafA/YrhL
VPGQPSVADRRLPGLDGLRALAVILVMAYHGGVPGLRVAGFYGVDLFFVLSGFLITRLLLEEVGERGRVRFAAFWGRRARRLLPGLLVMLAAVEAYVAYAAPPGSYPGFHGDALSVIGYLSNWHFIHASSNYFSSTGLPSLLTHTWSLAIEEQFYLLWPVVMWGAVHVARRARRRPASVVLAVSGAGALASTIWMAVLYRSGSGASRLYYGTDTHAQSILIGCALAALAAVIPLKLPSRLATPAAIVVACGLGWAACSLGGSDPLTYQGGFLAVSLLGALLVVVVVSCPRSIPARTLSLPPLAYVGRVSYGMYLWYFPLFAVITRANTGLAGANLFLVRCGAVVLAAVVSFQLIELPVRGWTPRLGVGSGAGLRPLLTGVAVVLPVGVLLVIGTPTTYSIGPSASPLAAAAQNVVPAGVGAASDAGGTAGTRILVFGDSTAATLGDDLVFSPAAQQRRVRVDVVGMFGCGLTVSVAVRPHGQPSSPPAPCRIASPPQEKWPALLAGDIHAYHPAVVLVAAGRWEVQTMRLTPGGPWVNITEPGDAADVRSQLELVASVVRNNHATLALATAPCYDSGEQPNGDPWPEDSRSRLNAYNSLVRQVATGENAAHPGAVVVVDLESMVCPGRQFHTVVDGVTARAPDGIHYPFFDVTAPNAPAPDTLAEAKAFGAWIGPKIFRDLPVGVAPR